MVERLIEMYDPNNLSKGQETDDSMTCNDKLALFN